MGQRIQGEPRIQIPWWKQATNVASAAGRAASQAVRGGEVLVSSEVAGSRLAVCRSGCAHYIPRSGRCTKCGCFVSAKAKLATEDCPMGLWPAAPNGVPRSVVRRKPCGGCRRRQKAKRRLYGSRGRRKATG